MMLTLLPLLIAGPTALAEDAPAPECASLPTAIAEINRTLDEALLDEAAALAESAQEALLCQPEPVNPMVLAAVFHLKGAVHTFQGKEKDAKSAFEWAASVSPLATLDPVLGTRAQEGYNAMRDEVMARPPGSLTVKGEAEAWIDGRPTPIDSPVELVAGPHLLQWRTPGEPTQGRTLEIAPREVRTLTVGDVAVPAASPSSSTDIAGAASLPDADDLAKRRMVYLASGGGLVATGGALLGIGLQKRGQVAGLNANDEDALRELAAQANTLGAMGMTTAGLGAGLLGLGLLTTGPEMTVSLGGQF